MNAIPPPCQARPATPDDLREIAEILQAVFGTPRSVEALRRKFTGWAGTWAGSAVLTGENGVVGFLGQIPVRVSVAGREVLAAQGADVAILKNHRRLDSFLRLVCVSTREMKKAGVALAYGVTNADAASVLTVLGGPGILAPIPLLVRPLGGSVCRRLLAGVLAGVRRVAARGPATLPRGRGPVRLDRFDSRFDDFWKRTRNDYAIMLVRDAAYLNWRYADAGAVAYQRMAVERTAGGEIAGYVVLRTSQRGDSIRGRICDLVTPRYGEPRIAHDLLDASLDWFRQQKADVADIWMFRHAHLRGALRRHGFVPRRAARGGLRVESLTPGVAASGDTDWFLSLGDSDAV